MINQLPAATQSELEILLHHHLEQTFPACAIAVIKDGDWILDAVWGHVEEYPITEDTLFDLASVTKLFTITAFLSLVSAGKIGLHDPLVRVIPEFGTVSPRGMDGGQDPHSKVHLPTPEQLVNQTVDPAAVTFWHLLTHTSGLPAWRDVYNAAGPAPTPPDQPDPIPRAERWAKGLAALCSYPFVGQPGEKVVYSDVGLMLLGEATARLADTPLETFIQARVLDPLQLKNARFNPIRDWHFARAGIAPTENDATWRYRRAWGEVHDENACGVGGIAGHAGLFANARDVARFGEAWLYEAEAQFGIDPELAADAQREQAETDGARRGLGFALKAHHDAAAGDKFSARTFGHTGFTGTSLWIDPERELVVACLTNRVYPGREKEGIHPFRRALHDLLVTALR
jgi:CubicO group peptidase (beta-lactamase class C family)